VTALCCRRPKRRTDLGEARDRVVDRVQTEVAAKRRQVQHVAEEVGETAAKEAKNQGLTQDAGSGSGA
jgi:hypothetical protein